MRVVLTIAFFLSMMTIVWAETENKSLIEPYVDVHDHLVARTPKDYEGAVKYAVSKMDECGIRKMIVMPQPFAAVSHPYECDSFLAAIRKYPTRFAFLAGGGSLNVMIQQASNQTQIGDDLRRRFEKKAEELLKLGACGFGEIAIHHLSHGGPHPYESVSADHPLLLLLADIAARHDVVLDVHLDVVAEDMATPPFWSSPLNPKSFSANITPFERLLEHNPKAKIIWEHAGSDTLGQWTHDLSRRLLEKHPNLYIAFRIPPDPGQFPVNNPMMPDGNIKPPWLRLMQDFPTRFMVGSDWFIASPDFQGDAALMEKTKKMTVQGADLATRKFISALAPDLARKISWENAAAIYKFSDLPR